MPSKDRDRHIPGNGTGGVTTLFQTVLLTLVPLNAGTRISMYEVRDCIACNLLLSRDDGGQSNSNDGRLHFGELRDGFWRVLRNRWAMPCISIRRSRV